MTSIENRIADFNWQNTTEEMDSRGYALLPGLLEATECQYMIDLYQNDSLFRKVINMERYRFGKGEYKYFSYPLPGMIQAIRQAVFPYLVPVANAWMKHLKMDRVFPPDLPGFQQLCHSHGQVKPTVLILKYGEGCFNTLHQDLYGDIFFPFQAVLFLNEPGKDYFGGEFVLTEQIPRAQSKAIVLQPKQGDMLIFTTSFRPVNGSKGYYRANMKHGVSEIQGGQRHTLGIIFHDALS